MKNTVKFILSIKEALPIPADISVSIIGDNFRLKAEWWKNNKFYDWNQEFDIEEDINYMNTMQIFEINILLSDSVLLTKQTRPVILY